MASLDDHDRLTLPRSQFGHPPQRLLTTLLGDYWVNAEGLLPSGALVGLVGEFGVTPLAGRAAISRLARRGLLKAAKQGRYTHYGLTDPARLILRRGAGRIVSFGRN